MMNRSQTSAMTRARCANSSDGPSRPSSKPSTCSITMTRRIAGTELEDADDAAVGEERQRPRFVAGTRGTPALAPVAADDLSSDDAIELQVLELVDLAHAAARRCARSSGSPRTGAAAVARRSAIAVRRPAVSDAVSDEVLVDRARRSGVDELGPVGAQTLDGSALAVQHVVLDEPCRAASSRSRRTRRSSMAVGPRERERQRRHRARELHAAGVLGLAEAPRDLGKRQLLERSQQDHLAVGVGQRLERGFERARPARRG